MITLDLDTRGLAEAGKLWLDRGDRGIARISRVWLDRDGRGVAKVYDDGMGGARRWRYRERVAPTFEHNIKDLPRLRWRYRERMGPTQTHTITDTLTRRWRYRERMGPTQTHTVIETLERRWRYSERLVPTQTHTITDAPPRRWRYRERMGPKQAHTVTVPAPRRWRYRERTGPVQTHTITGPPDRRWRYSERFGPTQKHTVEDVKCDVTITGPDRVAGGAVSRFQANRGGDCALQSGTWSTVIHNRYATRDRGWASIDSSGEISVDLPTVGGPTIYRILATYTPSTGKAGTSTYFYFTAHQGCAMAISSTSGFTIDGDTKFEAQAQMVGQCEGSSTLPPGPWRVSGTADAWVMINAASGKIEGTAPNRTQSYSLDVTWTDDKGTDFTEGRTISVTQVNIPCTVAITSDSSQVRSQAEWTGQASTAGDCPSGVWSVQSFTHPTGTQDRVTGGVAWAQIDQTGKITFKTPFDVSPATDYRIRAWWTGTSDTYSADYVVTVLPPVDCHVMISGPGQVEVGKRWSGTATLDGTECPASVTWAASGVAGITASPASVLAGDSAKVNVGFTAPLTKQRVTIAVSASDSNGLIDRALYGIDVEETVPCGVVLASTSGFTIDGNTQFGGQASTTGDCDGPASMVPGPWSVSGSATTSFGVRIDGNGKVESGDAPNRTATYDLTVSWRDEHGVTFSKSYTITVNKVPVPCVVTVSSSDSQVRALKEWTGQASTTGDCGAGSWSVAIYNHPQDLQGTNNRGWASINQSGSIRFTVPFDVAGNPEYRVVATWTSGSTATAGEFVVTVLPVLKCNVSISGKTTLNAGEQYNATASLSGTECPSGTPNAGEGWSLSGGWANLGIDHETGSITHRAPTPTTDTDFDLVATYTDGSLVITGNIHRVTVKAQTVACQATATGPATVNAGDAVTVTFATTGDCGSPSSVDDPWTITAPNWMQKTVNGASAQAAPSSASDVTYTVSANYSFDGKTASTSHQFTVRAAGCAVAVSGSSTVRALNEWIGQASTTGACGSGSWSVAIYNHPHDPNGTNNRGWASIDQSGVIKFTVPFDVAGNPEYRVVATWTSGSTATAGEFVITALPVLKCNVSISGKTTLNAGEQYNATASISGTDCPTGSPAAGEGWSLSGGWANLGIGHDTGSIVHRAPTPTTDTTYDLIATYTDGSLVITGNIHRVTVKAQTVACQATATGPATVNAGDAVTVTFATTGDCGSPSSVDDPWTITAPNWMTKGVNGASATAAPSKATDETYTVSASYSFDGKTASTSHQFTVKAAACAVTVTGSTSQVRSQRDWTGTATKTGSCGSGSWSVKTLNHPSGTTNRVTNNVPWATIDSNGAISFKIPFDVGSKTDYRIQAAWTSGTDITLGEFVLSVLPPLDCAVVLTGPSSVEAGKTWTGTASLDGSECPSGATWSASGIAGISASPSSTQVGAASSATIRFTAPASAGTVDISVTAKDGTETLDTATKTITVTDPVTCDVAVTSTSGFNIDGNTKFAGNAATTGTCASPASAIPGPWSVSGTSTTSFGVKVDGNGRITSNNAPNSNQQYSLVVTWTDVNGHQFSSSHTITVTYVPPTCTVGISSSDTNIVGPGTWTGQASQTNCGSASWSAAVYTAGTSNDRGWASINQSSGRISVSVPFAVSSATTYEVEAFYGNESSGRIGFTVLPPWNCTISGPSDMNLTPGETRSFVILLGSDCPRNGGYSSPDTNVSVGANGVGTVTAPQTPGTTYVSVDYSDGSQVASTSWAITVSDPDPCRLEFTAGASAVRSGRNYTAKVEPRGNCPSVNSDRTDRYSLSGGWSGLQIGVAGDIWGTAPTVSAEVTYTLTASVKFTDGSTASESHRVTVQPPVAGCDVTVTPVGGGTARVVEGAKITLTAAEDGNCGASGTWSVGVSPSGPTVDINSSTGGITFTAPATITGTSRDYTVTATWQSDDGSITENGSATVTVLSFDCTVGIGGASRVDGGDRYQAQATLAGTDCPTGTPNAGEGFAMTGGWSGLGIDHETGEIDGRAPNPSTDTTYSLEVTYTDGSTVVTGIRHQVTVRGTTTTNCQATSSGPATVDSGDSVSVSFSTFGTCGSPSGADDPWTITAPDWMSKSADGASGTAPSDPDDQTYTVSGSYRFGTYAAATSHQFTVTGDGPTLPTCSVSGPSTLTVVGDVTQTITFSFGVGVDANCGPGSWSASGGFGMSASPADPTSTATTINCSTTFYGSFTVSYSWTRSADGQSFGGSTSVQVDRDE